MDDSENNASELIKIIGLDGTLSGEDSSEQSLRSIFALASEFGCSARFLRLGGPKQFRADVIAFVDETRNSITPGYKLLLDANIPEIEFILTNPFSEAFLTRMDAEGKTNWDIRRVKEQIIDFARGLLRASQQRINQNLSEIKLAFHSTELIWNLNIAEGHCVVARAYYQSSTGHDDNVAEIRLELDSQSRLAESLVSYFNSVKDGIQTESIHTEDDLTQIGDWPSLFKGNAVQNPSDSSAQWVEKSCTSVLSDKVESQWLSSNEIEKLRCVYFNPLKLARSKQRTRPWKGQTMCLRRVDGMLATDMLWQIQLIGAQYPELRSQLETFSGAIIYQAFQALREFRNAAKRVKHLRDGLRPYPWGQKLEKAIFEAGKFVFENQRDFSSCRTEARRLGQRLESFASHPFRDAHLKNRIIAIDASALTGDYNVLREWLQTTSPEEVFERLKRATFDIDFETCMWKVSEWDDPLHILWSTGLDHSNLTERGHVSDLFRPWWTQPQSSEDYDAMWMTLFCRSLREFCRRLWYKHIMPRTYQCRYGTERYDLFLNLAIAASDHVDGYTTIKVFLEKCKLLGDSVWKDAKNLIGAEPITAEFPPFVQDDSWIARFVDLDPEDDQLVPHSRILLKPIHTGNLAPSTEVRSGGANLDGNQVTVGGDVAGRDKIISIHAEPGATVIVGPHTLTPTNTASSEEPKKE
jgi:hypothetical protein